MRSSQPASARRQARPGRDPPLYPLYQDAALPYQDTRPSGRSHRRRGAVSARRRGADRPCEFDQSQVRLYAQLRDPKGTGRDGTGTRRGCDGDATGGETMWRRCCGFGSTRSVGWRTGSILGPGDRLRRLGSRSGKGKIIEIALEARRPYHDLVSVDPEIVAEI